MSASIPFVYSDRYEADIGDHVFPTSKYRLVRTSLLELGACGPEDFVESAPPAREDLALVHTAEYLDDLDGARVTPRTVRSELPITPSVIGAFRLAAGGSVLAARLAAERGAAVHIGGGLHHAFPDHAEGFCYVNDVAVAARVALRDGLARKVLVVDVDLHQGNGTAAVFRNDDDVFTFSIHQENNYPVKEKSDLDIGLADGTGDDEYLARLAAVLPGLRDRVRPGLVVYVAGADPYEDDRLGGLALTREGLRERDRLVFDTFGGAGVPVAVTLAGGYARAIADTVAIHTATCIEAIRAAEIRGRRGP
ncbi:MAG: histone deacetylase [Candidatus Eisenbacteria bacterium]